MILNFKSIGDPLAVKFSFHLAEDNTYTGAYFDAPLSGIYSYSVEFTNPSLGLLTLHSTTTTDIDSYWLIFTSSTTRNPQWVSKRNRQSRRNRDSEELSHSSMNSIETPDWSTLPPPQDDGAVRHLVGLNLPSIPLLATDRSWVNLSALTGLIIIYAYPRTGRPGIANPDGWDLIPGARGLSPNLCVPRSLF